MMNKSEKNVKNKFGQLSQEGAGCTNMQMLDWSIEISRTLLVLLCDLSDGPLQPNSLKN